jgi:hypothetical protein
VPSNELVKGKEKQELREGRGENRNIILLPQFTIIKKQKATYNFQASQFT